MSIKTQRRYLLSLIPAMERALIDAACECHKLESACVQERPYDPVWAQAYKAKVVLMRVTDNLLDTRAEIEYLTQVESREG